MKNYENYFGLSDSSKASSNFIVNNHLLRNIETRIKAYDKMTGKQIIVGIKGSGKTDIRRFIEEKDNAVTLNLNADSSLLNIDVNTISGKSGRIKNAISLILLDSFISYIIRNFKKNSGFKTKLKQIADSTKDRLKNIPDAVNIATPFGGLDIKKLLNPNASRLVHNTLTELIDKVVKALDNKHAYILIDDTEDVFPGIEGNIDFLEGLSRAVYDINNLTNSKVHVLLFLKYGFWRQWFENQRELDKIFDAVMILSWNHDDLCKVISQRIANIHHIDYDKKLRDEDLWNKEFNWNNNEGFNKFATSIARYCVNGPRDIITICNMAKKGSKSEKINSDSIKEILAKYSELKIYEIHADFGDVYPNVHKFVELVFYKLKPEGTGKYYAQKIEDNGLMSDKAEAIFKNESWFNSSSKEKLVSIMYEIGIIGKKNGRGKTLYSIEHPGIPISDLMNSTLVVHPAFRPYLSIKVD